MEKYPLISVITAVYNGAPYLEALIESTLNQDYPHFEHIIIDDGSNDNGATVAILKKYPHLRWWSRENKGQYATQNEGILAARGEIVGIISADDIYIAPNTFSNAVKWFQSHPNFSLLYGKTLYMNKEGKLLDYQLDIAGKYPKGFMRIYPYVPHSSLFVASSLLNEKGIRFDPTSRYYGDWDWIIRLFSESVEIGFIPKCFSTIRVHPNQTSRTSNAVSVIQERRKVCKKYGVNYQVHMFVRRLIQLRAIFIIAFCTFKKQGVSELIKMVRDWFKKRF